MAFVPVPPSRASAIDSPDGLQFVIPAKRNIFAMIFLSFWLVGWAFGEISAAKELLAPKSDNPGGLFLLAWLGAWSVGGAFAVLTWAWMLSGRERVVLRTTALVHRRELFGYGRTREFDLSHVRALRVAPQSTSAFDLSSGTQFWGFSGGPLAFDYGSRTIRFGASLDEAEAKTVLEALLSRNGVLAHAGAA